MPSRTKRPCKYAGCSELVSPGDRRGFCTKHSQMAKPTQTDRARLNLYDRKWQKRRRLHLSENPWCVDCLGEVPQRWTPATEVHHVEAHGGDTEIFRRSPLLSLCKSCHSSRTRAERKIYGG
jgi:5-methylcytosine-specific restriction enzyme A